MTPVPSSLPPRLRCFPSRKSHAGHTVSNGYVPRNGLRRDQLPEAAAHAVTALRRPSGVPEQVGGASLHLLKSS